MNGSCDVFVYSRIIRGRLSDTRACQYATATGSLSSFHAIVFES